MIDLKQLREDPDRFKRGAAEKKMAVDIDRLVALDEQRRALMVDQESKRAEQKKISKEIGPQIGKLKGQLKGASDADRPGMETQIQELEAKPAALKAEIQALDEQLAAIEPEMHELHLKVPQPPDDDVPKGESEADNVQLKTWNPDWFDQTKSFRDNKGFDPRSHMDLMQMHAMVDFERAVKMSGTRHYCLTGDGMRLQQAVLRFAFDHITNNHGFKPMSVPVIVREECMVGTGFFPEGRDQAYHIEETSRGAGHDLFLTGTGEVGLMGLHAGELLDESQLPIQYATVSTCFRREAGAAGKDTAGLFRVHQFDKVEQVVICKADEAESRAWHTKMIGIVEELLQTLQLPHRLLQCCTADLGPKNADMIDLECWMPSRGPLVDVDQNTGKRLPGLVVRAPEYQNLQPTGAYGETHSASRLYDYQCRRLNMRYKTKDGKNVICHSLNNTVAASPRILVPIIEMYQNEDGSITVPEALRAYMNGLETIG